jgi:hypothetical protein
MDVTPSVFSNRGGRDWRRRKLFIICFDRCYKMGEINLVALIGGPKWLTLLLSPLFTCAETAFG